MVKHYSRKLIFSIFASLSLTVSASVVPVKDARELAGDFFRARSVERLASADALELVYTSGSPDRPVYYVFNARDGRGHIIMSADDGVAPVLGYSSECLFDSRSVPPALKWVLQGLENEIKSVSSSVSGRSIEDRRRLVRRSSRSGDRIELNTPQWRQESPFNSKIPGNPLSGCVGTAMAMIMKYHNYPERGRGSYNGVNFDVAYDWDNMRMDNYRSGYTQEEADAVSTLVWHAGVSIGTQFGYSGSSAYEVKVPAALINYFGYDPGVSYKKRSETSTQAEFDRIVENEIRAGRPVLYCGQDVTAGHAFVVDGYDPMFEMIHVNWGWGGADGNNNGGWYTSTALNPTVSQSHSFNNLTTIIYNIKPGTGDTSIWSPIHITADGRQAGMNSNLEGTLVPGNYFTVRVGNLKNVSYEKFSGKIAVALFDSDGKFKCTLSNPEGFTLNGMEIFVSGYADFRCALPENIAVSAGDMIRMATTGDNGVSWQPVAGELITRNEIPAVGAVPDYFRIQYPSGVADAEITGQDKVIKGWNYSFRVVPSYPDRDVVTVKNNGYVLTPDANYNYTIFNVLEDQQIEVYVQNAAEVKEKRSIWVGEPGTLSELLSGSDAGTVKDLTLFGTIDARDFTYMRSSMKLTRLDLSSVRIAANGTNQANAIPREAFRNLWSLKEVLLPSSVNRLNNGCFRCCGITSIVIPAAVSTYEYNVFNGSSELKDVWVLNPNPAFINWCVFYGTPKNRTVHCVNMGSAASYQNNKYWNQPDLDAGVTFTCPATDGNQFPSVTDCAFAVMDNSEVKFVCDTETGRYESGKEISFTAEHIADNDNRMDVYANNMLLKPDAEGKYSVKISGSTIIHFDMVKPMETASYESPWKLTDTGGTVGLLTDVVNVMPGVNFTIRANSFATSDNAVFWAAVLTTSDGKIKEFISPVSTWNSGAATGQRMTINCCVKDASVKEGNYIRLATSFNSKTWALVNGSNENVIDRLPALNNTTPVYTFTFPEDLEKKANLQGVVTSAVRGRDLTFKITPKSASHTMNVSVNGERLATGVKTFSHTFIALENLDFDIEVIPPVSYTEATIVLNEGEHLYLNGTEGITDWGKINYETAQKYQSIKKLKIVGNLDYYDFNFFRENYSIAANIRLLDLSEANFVRDRDKPEFGNSDWFPSIAFYNPQLGGCLIEEVILPNSVKMIDHDAFKGCRKIREIRLPEQLHAYGTIKVVNAAGNGWSKVTKTGLGDDVFAGCESLETIYVPCAPKSGGNVGHLYYSANHILKTGLPDNSKVTVVVPEEYLSAYKTPRTDNGWFEDQWSNGWEAGGFNIVGEYPVYSLEYDASRCFITEDISDVTKAVSFLKDNIGIEQTILKLYIGAKSNVSDNRPEGIDAYDPEVIVKVYDNGELLPDAVINSDGSIDVSYFNPNVHSDKSGSHKIDVKYYRKVNFNCVSDLLKIVDAESGNMLTSVEVEENSILQFRATMDNVDTDNLTSIVKSGENVISKDDTGLYTLYVTDSNIDLNVFAVPHNGATLNASHADVIDASQAENVTSLSFTGEIEPEKLKEVIDKLPVIEELDLSGLEVALPEGALAGKTTLTTVTLPQSTDIEANTFAGCTNLTSVNVPECVNYIGNNAFSGCSSLTSLSFTGIRGLGENVFEGCDNITTIIFNSDHGDTSSSVRARRVSRSTRASGFSENSFGGLNPNCLVYLDENEEIPAGVSANFIKVKTTGAGDAMERSYLATSDITLDPSYPFNAINAFKLGENKISLDVYLRSTGENPLWNGLLLPFTPTKLSDAAGGEISALTDPTFTPAEGKHYLISSFGDDGNEFILKSEIKANTPYIASWYMNSDGGPICFSAENTTVEQTPEQIVTEGLNYNFTGTFNEQKSTPETYLLDSSRSSFVPVEAVEGEFPAISPFSVYMVTSEGSDPKDIIIDGLPVGVEMVKDDANSLRISREGSMLMIESRKACEINLYSIDGTLVRVLHLLPGFNAYDGIASGMYILDGIKVVL